VPSTAPTVPRSDGRSWPPLSRFGILTNLAGTESTPADVFPRTQTFTFHGASYASDALAFVPVEANTNQPDPTGGYTALEQPTAEERALLQHYDGEAHTSQTGAIPFLMIGNQYISIGASYSPSVLQGMSREEIGKALSDTTSRVAQSVDRAANTLTAAICQATNGNPSSVCSDPAIAKISQTLRSA
jgi:Domain of unknown function (DUF929)